MKKITLAALVCISTVLLPQKTVAQVIQRPAFNHQTIYVVDLQKASDFYEKVLQLEKIPEPFHDNKHTWFKVGEHSQLHVVSGAKEIIAHDINIHLAFSVPSLPVFMKHLDDLQMEYGNFKGDNKIIQTRPDEVIQVYFKDPDGYWIEVNNDRFGF